MEVLIGSYVYIGYGTIIQGGSKRATTIGDHVKIDSLCYIGHDSIISDRVCIAGGSTLAGWVEIGEDSFIGLGTTVKPKVKIGKRTMIGMGSVVTKDIPDGVIAYGNPCRVVRENRWYPPNSRHVYPNQP